MIDNTTLFKTYKMKNGVVVRKLHVSNMSLDDFALIAKIRQGFNQKSDADAVRFAIRKLAEQI